MIVAFQLETEKPGARVFDRLADVKGQLSKLPHYSRLYAWACAVTRLVYGDGWHCTGVSCPIHPKQREWHGSKLGAAKALISVMEVNP